MVKIINIKKYNKEKIIKLFIKPLISLKSIFLYKKYFQILFFIKKNISKIIIKKYIELLFKIKINSIRIIHRIGKKKKIKNISGKRKDKYIIFINLKKNSNINFIIK